MSDTITTAGGRLSIRGANIMLGGINTGSGALAVSASNATTLGGNITSGIVTINTNNIDLIGTITASGRVSLAPTTPSRAVFLGRDNPSFLSLTAAELGRINSPGLTIGAFSNTAGIVVGGAVNLSSLSGGALVLQSGGNISLNALLTSPVETQLISTGGNISA